MRRYHAFCLLGLTLIFLLESGCARRIPQIDLSGLDPAYLEECSKASGVLVVLDERLESNWGAGYDKTKWLLLGEERGEDPGRAPTTNMVIHRRLLKVLNEAGAKAASKIQVVHYRQQLPPVEVHVWQATQKPRPVNLRAEETLPLADWHCEHSWPRRSTFRVSTLRPGDLVEIITPLVGPDMLEWNFASSEHCVMHSIAKLGHEAAAREVCRRVEVRFEHSFADVRVVPEQRLALGEQRRRARKRRQRSYIETPIVQYIPAFV